MESYMEPRTCKVIIAGSRDFKDYELLKKEMLYYLRNITGPIEIVSGGQVTTDKATGEKYGADYLGEQYAKEKGFTLKIFPAEWDKHGKAAGPIRNEEMAKYADHLVAFWDGKSAGTNDMIKKGKKYGLRGQIVHYETFTTHA